MKVKIKNIGVMREAEFELGKMTIICGKNNTGKTYATYTLYGFHSFWSQAFELDIDEKIINVLLANGVVNINVQKYADLAQNIITTACKQYSSRIANVFSANPDYFKDSSFDIDLDNDKLDVISHQYKNIINTAKGKILSLTKENGQTTLVVTLFSRGDKVNVPKQILQRYISDALKEIVFNKKFAVPFIASAERTGAAIFRRELNFARTRLLDKLIPKNKDVDPLDLLTKVRPEYPLPVEDNVEFTRQLETFDNDKSFIAEKYPDILDEFADIIGGDYLVRKNSELFYVPKHKRIRLSLDISSSAVRSLLDIGFYLRHEAQPGDFLMVDEPELNLHPENQCRIARLFARLLNIGITIFITTHSDYIIKELNTLIMLNNDKNYIKAIMKREGYNPSELIDAEMVRVYVAGESNIMCEGAKRKIKCCTLTKAEIDKKYGIEVTSFDNTINRMNSIQDDIIWGSD